MPAVIVTYRLTKDLTQYDNFFDILINENKGYQLFDCCILLPTPCSSPYALRRQLLPCLQPDDRLFIGTVQGRECAGLLPPKAKKWFKERIIDKELPRDFVEKQLRK